MLMVPEARRQGVALLRLLVCDGDADDDDGARGAEAGCHALPSAGL